MSIIEIGGYAGGIMSILALMTKIVNLITAIQSLIHRLDILQRDMDINKENQQTMGLRIKDQEQRVQELEAIAQDIHKNINSADIRAEELVGSAYGR